MDAARQFSVEVDERHRAKRLRFFSLEKPHARAFHAAWLAFFSANFAAFAVPSLVTLIRNDLSLTDKNITDAAIASIAGTVAARLVMGTVCELLGPRLGSASVLLCCSSATFGMALAADAAAFIALRLLMGVAMAVFVTMQYWTSIMYSPQVVGAANGLAAGLANSGAGLTHLFCIAVLAAAGAGGTAGGSSSGGLAQCQAWRVTLLLPGGLMIVVALGVLAFAQDCPDGDYMLLRESGVMQQPPLASALREAAANYRVWALAVTYAVTFGVELTINNFIQQYFEDGFDLDVTMAGVLSSLFGICNIVARPLGGVLSDAAARRQGIPGRLRVVCVLTALAGGACMALKAAVSTLAGTVVALIGSAGAGMAASGAVWGIVPFLGSMEALGAVAGIVGAAGPVGALVLSSAIMTTQGSKSDGFFYMGLVELCAAPLVLAIALPRFQRQQRQRGQQEQHRNSSRSAGVGAGAGGRGEGEGQQPQGQDCQVQKGQGGAAMVGGCTCASRSSGKACGVAAVAGC